MLATNSVKERLWKKGRIQYRYLDDERSKAEAVGYYDNGQLWFQHFIRDGRIQGLGKIWYEDGSLQCEEEYLDGNFHGIRKEWYRNGKLNTEIFYKYGLRDGTCKIWFENGQLRSESFYIAGKLHGLWCIWYLNGRFWSQGNYQNGQRHGAFKEWDERGKLKSTHVYVRGVKFSVSIGNRILSKQIRAEDILKVKNTTARRFCLEELGYERFLAQMPHEILHKEGDYELVRIDWYKREEPIYLVKVKCPSTGAFYTLRVPPTMKTVKEAIAWTFRVKEGEYRLETEA
ncbi:MAG: toxin-antitoxin system YwqK family antitoxin [Candidatus Omnitrophica bacterium]|nr:toxin-antitoxin system YwqK family antitoxin [Candidatus Omnitrophota bacterium]